jgi:cellulose synthase/poly-beta-1,6-N-acetylglucosamine synthase-like glycosyltransferase
MTYTLLLISSLAYGLLILYLARGWGRLKPSPSVVTERKVLVTIIIPARNEASHIGLLLDDIGRQHYPSPWLEVIVVDDASDDATAKVARQRLKKHSTEGRVIVLEEVTPNPSPKKRALAEGIKHATGDLIVTTDADCRVGEEWVSAIVHHALHTGAVFISGPVKHAPLTNTFSKLQALEFMSLVGAGAGAIGAGQALMSNGANIAFLKKAFHDVGGYGGNEQYVSGDDVFLMMKLQKTYGKQAITFLKDRDAIVKTAARETWKEFMEQRIRWASKTKAYKSFFALYASGAVFLFNVLLLISIVIPFFYPGHLPMVLKMWLMKFIVDAALLFPVTLFMNEKRLLWYYIPSQIFVMVYTSLAGFLGMTKKFSWKGRTYRK